MTQVYSGFALCYDALMSEVDYEAWTERLMEAAARHGAKPRTIADLACGTGNITNALAERGFDVIGVDVSQPMLSIAQDKAYEAHLKVRYLLQDIVTLQLHRPVDLLTMINDGINYIEGETQLRSAFEHMAGALKPGGLLLLEFSTPYKLEHVLGNTTIAESDEEISMIWENAYDPAARTQTMRLTFFLRDEDQPALYERFAETHVQHAHEVECLSKAASTWFDQVEHLDSETMRPLEPASERALLIFRRR